MTVFTELLAIKRYREQQAETAMQRERSLRDSASQAHREAQQALMDFRHFAAQREASLYAGLYRHPVRVSAINHVLASVRAMQEHDDTLQNRVDAAQTKLDEAQARFAHAREQHQRAVRATEKFIELSDIHRDAARREGERHEDLEMEEVASMMRDQDEWSNHEEVEIA